jgi:hypothetical protein
MAGQYTQDNSAVIDPDNIAVVDPDTDDEAYPNHGIDGNNAHDPAKGATIGGVGGAIVGGLAGGPVGAVIGAVAGAAASGAAVAGIDKKDDDNSRGEDTEYVPNRSLVDDSSDLP